MKLANLVSTQAISIALLIACSSGLGATTATAQEGATSPPPTHAMVRKANHRLEAAVRKQLAHSNIDVSDIRVIARSGKVSLEGTVPDASQIPVADAAARRTQGVSSVSNNLTLREEGGG